MSNKCDKLAAALQPNEQPQAKKAASDPAPSGSPDVPSIESAKTNGRTADGCFALGNPYGEKFKVGNEKRLDHGLRRRQRGSGAALDVARRVALRDAVIADLGGADSVSAVLNELVTDFANACTLRDVCFGHLALVGPTTSAGRRRSIVSLYLEASHRAASLAGAIGTSRKPARVPSLDQYLTERAATVDTEKETSR